MMSKKLYVEFARMIRKSRRRLVASQARDYDPLFLGGMETQISLFEDDLVSIFQNDNPRFIANKFIAECSIEEE